MNTGTKARSPREGVLRRRLLLAFLVLSLVPLFGSNAIGYLRSGAIVERLVTRYLDGIAALEATHVRGRVEQRLLYLTAIGNGNSFLEAAIRRATSGDTSGVAAAADGPGLREYLIRKLNESGHFGALALFTRSGDLIASTHDLNPVNEWRGRDTASVAILSFPDGTAAPTLWLKAPITESGEPAGGYLVATIPLQEGGEFLEVPRHVAGVIESFIVDTAGRPLFVSHRHGDLRADQPLATPLLRMEPGANARYRDREGVEVIGTSAALPPYGWLFIAEVPVADALGELGALRNLSLMLGTIFAVLVLGAGWLLAGGIVAPVRRLVVAARALGAGDLDVRVPNPGRDEIGELSEAFNEMADELQASQERIDLLHRREIERAQQLATVGELASAVAHEIKNPVIGISNGLDLVLRRVDDPALQPITSEMQRQLGRIEGAVRDLLTFARPPRLDLTLADLDQVVTRAGSLVGPAAAAKGVSLVTRPSHGLQGARVDPELIQQALVNLLMNAVQISSEGDVVTVETGSSTGEVFVAVQDEGPGITPEDLEQIFKPFYTTRHSGTGLGLSITRGIVERHGGRVEVRSEQGKGARFTIVLPVEGPEEGEGDDA